MKKMLIVALPLFMLFMLVATAVVVVDADAAPRTQTVSEVLNKLNGSPKWVASINATTSATSATIKSGTPHIIRCGAEAHYRADTATGTVTTSSTHMGLVIAANTNEYFTTTAHDTKVYVILASGSTACNVWELE